MSHEPRFAGSDISLSLFTFSFESLLLTRLTPYSLPGVLPYILAKLFLHFSLNYFSKRKWWLFESLLLSY